MIDVAMWARALQVIPRISKPEWDRLDIVSRWLVATRAAVLIMSFISAAIAGVLAVKAGLFDPLSWVLLVVGLVLAHATNNLLNDYVDHVRGVDRDNYFRTQYGPQPLEQGLLTKRGLLAYAALTGAVALAAGAYLVAERGPLALVLLAIGAFFLVFYTWPLKYVGLGEPTVLLVWGPLMVGGGYFVITGVWDWNVVIASLPYALGVTTVIFGKHIDKYDEDRAKGIHTVPVLIGERLARAVAVGMVALQYAAVAYLIVIGFFTPIMLLVVLALPMLRHAVTVFRRPRPALPPPDYPPDTWPLWFVGFAFVHNRRFGILYLLGLVVEATWHLAGH